MMVAAASDVGPWLRLRLGSKRDSLQRRVEGYEATIRRWDEAFGRTPPATMKVKARAEERIRELDRLLDVNAR